MSQEELLFKEAREAIDKNDFDKARDLLTRLLKLNRNNPEYWLWMSGVVNSQKERRYCLHEVLKLDPQNLTAARGLRLLGENVPLPGKPLDISQLRRDWKSRYDLPKPVKSPAIAARIKLFAYSMLSVLLVGGIAAVLVITLKPRYRPDTSPIMKFSLTPPATATVIVTPSPTFAGPAPLWTLLDATFTPTAIYVSTPHNRTEAYQAAVRAYQAGDFTRALNYFQQVLDVEPGSVDIQYLISDIYRQQGSLNSALEGFNECIKLDPSFAPAYLGKARVLMAAEELKPKDVVANLEKALELDSQYTEAMLELAQFQVDQGDAVSAAIWLEKISESIPPTGRVEWLWARIYLLQNKPALALTHIETANQLDPTLLPVYKLWGEVLLQELRFEDAVTPLETYETYASNDPEVYVLLARAYFGSDDQKKALEYANRALSGKTKPVMAYVIRGLTYYDQGKKEQAEKDFDNALRLDKNSLEANLGKGMILFENGYPGAAYEYINTAFDAASNDVDKAITLYWRALSLLELDQVSAARRDMEAFLAYPESVTRLEMRDRIISEYLKLVTMTPSPTSTITPTPLPTGTATPTPRASSTPTPRPTPSPTQD
jgi:tetratricopeptide (TPR) repeat protein